MFGRSRSAVLKQRRTLGAGPPPQMEINVAQEETHCGALFSRITVFGATFSQP